MNTIAADNSINYTDNTRIIKIKNTHESSIAKIYAKCEFENPSGSHKDRVYGYMIESLELNNIISPGMTLIDCSTGNGGAALARIGTARGYNVIIFMPEGMTEERLLQIQTYGAQIIQTPKAEFIYGGVNRAGQFAAEAPNERFFLDQASNPLNTEAWRICGKAVADFFDQMEEKIDVFICGIGTGGTFSGIATELRMRFPQLLTVGIEVDKSAPLYAKRNSIAFCHCPHNLMGMGTGIISENTKEHLIDHIETVSGDDAWATMKELIHGDKLMIGPTAGANVFVAKKYAKKFGSEKNILTVLFDSAWKYFSRWDGKYPEYSE
jgi:cysteine synthase